MLSATFGQAKYNPGRHGGRVGHTADWATPWPLPYLSNLATSLIIKVTIPKATEKVSFRDSQTVIWWSWKPFGIIRRGNLDTKLVKKQEEVKEAGVTMDTYNRYTIAVRGVSGDIYGILCKANIETEFLSLLSTTMPSPSPQGDASTCGPLNGWVSDPAVMPGYLTTSREKARSLWM